MKIGNIWTDQYGDRPENINVDTLVVHTMYHPEDNDCFCAVKCKSWLDQCGVSAHYIIDRKGTVVQTVALDKMAWHAGESQMPYADDQRTRVNDFSIGVELLASEDEPATEEQYKSLVELTSLLMDDYDIASIVGHQHIAPERKSDPWNFDWAKLKSQLEAEVPGDLRIGV